MKPIFFAYPGGLAGVALLLLRASVVIWLGTVGAGWPGWAAMLAVPIVIALSLGFATRIAAGLCGVGIAVMLWPMPTGVVLAFLPHALDAAVLALIGPGALSIDAVMFGRRTMHLSG